MGLFSFGKRDNPILEQQRLKKAMEENLSNYYQDLLENGKKHFTTNQVLKETGIPAQSQAEFKMFQDIIFEEVLANRLYATWHLICPNCKREMLAGALLPHRNPDGVYSLTLQVAQVNLMQLELICPYCSYKFPKGQALWKLAADEADWTLTPDLVNWYYNQNNQ